MHNRDFHLPPATYVLVCLLYRIGVAAIPSQCFNVYLIFTTNLRTTPLTEVVIVSWRQSAFPPITSPMHLKSRVVMIRPLLHFRNKITLTQINSSSISHYGDLIGWREPYQITLRYLILSSASVEHNVGVHGNKSPPNVCCY